ncbi:hypothetical protein [Parvularcula sp. IMCC14364]|uniref:hypothetical protein n=1 Tax=Parvularcula sp. IMCC14364 TaxID=3067902 RepID=UPI0027405491|nr:hypothetical protein [Parvularcula sp. IMCC14364]
MISPDYIKQQFQGVIAMLRDEEWRETLDTTEDGVFRSFWAIPLCLVVVAVSSRLAESVLRLNPELELPDLPVVFDLTLQSVIFLSIWALTLFLLVGFARQIGAGGRVAPLIVSYNWSALLLNLLNMVFLVFASVTQALEVLVIFSLALQAFWFVMRWRLIRASLESDVGPTVGVLVIIFLATFLVSLTIADLGVWVHGLFAGN